MGGKISMRFFIHSQNLCALSLKYCAPLRKFALPYKTIVLSRVLRSPCKLCIRLQKYLNCLSKVLLFPDKLYVRSQNIKVPFIAPLTNCITTQKYFVSLTKLCV